MIKKITFDIYPVKLYIFIDEADEDILTYAEKEDITELTEDLIDFNDSDEASFAYKDTVNIAIRLRGTDKPEYIVHESFHATCYIMRYMGIKLSKSSEEAYAYLQQYIFDNIVD